VKSEEAVSAAGHRESGVIAAEGEGLGVLAQEDSGLFKEVIAIFVNEARVYHLH
jgi:hypothetical protein